VGCFSGFAEKTALCTSMKKVQVFVHVHPRKDGWVLAKRVGRICVFYTADFLSLDKLTIPKAEGLGFEPKVLDHPSNGSRQPPRRGAVQVACAEPTAKIQGQD